MVCCTPGKGLIHHTFAFCHVVVVMATHCSNKDVLCDEKRLNNIFKCVIL